MARDPSEAAAQKGSTLMMTMTKRLQVAQLQARLRPLRMTAGRYKTLMQLPQSRMERALRRLKLDELEAEIARLERILAKAEAAQNPTTDKDC